MNLQTGFDITIHEKRVYTYLEVSQKIKSFISNINTYIFTYTDLYEYMCMLTQNVSLYMNTHTGMIRAFICVYMCVSYISRVSCTHIDILNCVESLQHCVCNTFFTFTKHINVCMSTCVHQHKKM